MNVTVTFRTSNYQFKITQQYKLSHYLTTFTFCCCQSVTTKRFCLRTESKHNNEKEITKNKAVLALKVNEIQVLK